MSSVPVKLLNITLPVLTADPGSCLIRRHFIRAGFLAICTKKIYRPAQKAPAMSAGQVYQGIRVWSFFGFTNWEGVGTEWSPTSFWWCLPCNHL